MERGGRGQGSGVNTGVQGGAGENVAGPPWNKITGATHHPYCHAIQARGSLEQGDRLAGRG